MILSLLAAKQYGWWHMTEKETMKLALDVLEYWDVHGKLHQPTEEAITALKEALAQPEQEQGEPVAYDKTEINFFVQDLYDKKMQEGKHGHYETMFHVVHQAIKRATPPQRTEPLIGCVNHDCAKCKEKNT